MNRRILTLTWNTASTTLAITPSTAELMREEPFRLLLVTDVDLADAPAVTGALKADGDFDGDPLWSFTGGLTRVAPCKWYADVLLSSSAINTLLAVNEDPTDDVKTAAVVLQLRLAESDVVTAKSAWLPLTLKNDYSRPADLTPQAQPSPEDWLGARAVRFDVAQTLSDGQKAQARENIGAGTGDGGGAANFSDLGDKATADLPGTNTPLATALAGKLSLAGGTMTGNVGLADGVAVDLDNGAMLRKGTTDDGRGGNKGMSQFCSLGHERNWNAGWDIIRQDNGNIIEVRTFIGSRAPIASDDVTKGVIVGTRWVERGGTVSECYDNTTNAALWIVISRDTNLIRASAMVNGYTAGGQQQFTIDFSDYPGIPFTLTFDGIDYGNSAGAANVPPGGFNVASGWTFSSAGTVVTFTAPDSGSHTLTITATTTPPATIYFGDGDGSGTSAIGSLNFAGWDGNPWNAIFDGNTVLQSAGTEGQAPSSLNLYSGWSYSPNPPYSGTATFSDYSGGHSFSTAPLTWSPTISGGTSPGTGDIDESALFPAVTGKTAFPGTLTICSSAGLTGVSVSIKLPDNSYGDLWTGDVAAGVTAVPITISNIGYWLPGAASGSIVIRIAGSIPFGGDATLVTTDSIQQ